MAGADETAEASKALALGTAGVAGTAVSSKALARFAVAQQDISRAQNCAREIVAVLRRLN